MTHAPEATHLRRLHQCLEGVLPVPRDLLQRLQPRLGLFRMRLAERLDVGHLLILLPGRAAHQFDRADLAVAVGVLVAGIVMTRQQKLRDRDAQMALAANQQMIESMKKG